MKENTCIGCSECGEVKTRVTQTQNVLVGWLRTKRRRHVCSCGHRYFTLEMPEELALEVLSED